MFFYLSFLRPPPAQTSISSPILIAPQIANDLRTEFSPHAHDIYYTWLPSNDRTQPQKLTTWNPNTLYPKTIPVPPPPSVIAGKSYVLALCCDSSLFVDLRRLSNSPSPFPVLSKPVLFSKNKAPNEKKQEQVERMYRLERDDMVLKIKEQTSFDLDKKVWDSGIGLSGWLSDLLSPANLADSCASCEPLDDLRERLSSSATLNVVELGAGTGIVSLVLAALRSSMLRRDTTQMTDDAAITEVMPNFGKVVTTDLSSAMPSLEDNIRHNTAFFDVVKPQAMVLDWDHCDDFGTDEIAWDLILMADVTYNTTSFPALIQTISKLLKSSTKSKPLVLLGYKQRDPSERTLFSLAKQTLGFKFVRVGSRHGWQGSGTNGGSELEEVEIWLARVDV